MRIPLNIEKTGFVTTIGTIRSERLRIFKSIKFILDTGSPKSFLSELDAHLLNIPFAKLNFTESALLGGTKIALALIDVSISFLDEKNNVKKYNPKNFYVAKGMWTKHGIVSATPSILGSDFLKETEMALYFNPSKSIAYLEKEENTTETDK